MIHSPVTRVERRRPRGTQCIGPAQVHGGGGAQPTDLAIHTSSARLPSDIGSWFGTSVGVGQRTGRKRPVLTDRPVAAALSSGLRRVQQANLTNDLRAARRRPLPAGYV